MCQLWTRFVRWGQLINTKQQTKYYFSSVHSVQERFSVLTEDKCNVEVSLDASMLHIFYISMTNALRNINR